MEEKKTNELTDETLDAVTGGAFYQNNEKTGNDTSCQTEEEANLPTNPYSDRKSSSYKFRISDPDSAHTR